MLRRKRGLPKPMTPAPPVLERRGFAPGWKMSLFVAAMLPTVLALGFWQLDRADLKRGYEASYFDRMAQPAGPVPDDPAGAAFMRVSVAGRYDTERYFLVDNQVHEGRTGYWLIAVLRADDGRQWLVNRGWIAAPPVREELPVVDIPPDRVVLTGVLWPDTGMVPLLAQDRWADGWPKRVQRLDIEAMAVSVGGGTPAAEIRLEGGQPGVEVPANLGHDFKSRTHEGYAAQWFGLGGVLIVGYLFYGFRRHA